MKKKKPLKIVGLEKCLKNLPEGDKADLAEEIKKIFSDPDELAKHSKPVQELPPGSTKCPHCKGKLSFMKDSAFSMPGSDQMIRLADCQKCDLPFMVEAGN
jgi:hypothetical protein